MIYNILDIYNTVALKTGFPVYTNETDTPDITRFLLDIISDAVISTVHNVYLRNNILERTDGIVTIPEKSEYGVEGIIKAVNVLHPGGRWQRIPYNNEIDYYSERHNQQKPDFPQTYVIKSGYLKFYPAPDKAYKVKITLSTTDIILADNDTSKNYVDSVNDSIVCDADFARAVTLRATALVFARANNANAAYYTELSDNCIRHYIEKDYKTLEAERFFRRRAGHYSPYEGFLD